MSYFTSDPQNKAAAVVAPQSTLNPSPACCEGYCFPVHPDVCGLRFTFPPWLMLAVNATPWAQWFTHIYLKVKNAADKTNYSSVSAGVSVDGEVLAAPCKSQETGSWSRAPLSANINTHIYIYTVFTVHSNAQTHTLALLAWFTQCVECYVSARVCVFFCATVMISDCRFYEPDKHLKL